MRCSDPTPGLPPHEKTSLRGAARADELVVDEVGGHADEREIAPALPDDLVARRERDEVGEAFQRDGVAVADQPGHRLRQRHDLRHVGKASGRAARSAPPGVQGVTFTRRSARRGARVGVVASGELTTTFTIGDRAVHRLGYGTMQLTGPGRLGAARGSGGRGGRAAPGRGAGRRPLRHRRLLRPLRRRGAAARGAAPLRRADHRDQGGLPAHGPRAVGPCGRPEYLRQECEMSLRRLGVERIDLFQLHRIDPTVPADEQFGLLAELQAEGKVGAVGLSEVGVDQIERARARRRRRDRPEPLQPPRPGQRRRAALLHRAGHRLHAVVPDRVRAARRAGRAGGGGGRAVRRHRARRWRWRGCCSGRR